MQMISYAHLYGYVDWTSTMNMAWPILAMLQCAHCMAWPRGQYLMAFWLPADDVHMVSSWHMASKPAGQHALFHCFVVPALLASRVESQI